MLSSEAEMRKKQMKFSNMLASNATLLLNYTRVTFLARQMYQTEDQEKLHCTMEPDSFHGFHTSLNWPKSPANNAMHLLVHFFYGFISGLPFVSLSSIFTLHPGKWVFHNHISITETTHVLNLPLSLGRLPVHLYDSTRYNNINLSLLLGGSFFDSKWASHFYSTSCSTYMGNLVKTEMANFFLWFNFMFSILQFFTRTL